MPHTGKFTCLPARPIDHHTLQRHEFIRIYTEPDSNQLMNRF
jgi:hypothetical protein